MFYQIRMRYLELSASQLSCKNMSRGQQAFIEYRCKYKVDATIKALLTAVFRVNPYDRHQLKEHFGFGFSELHIPLVPAGTFQIQAIHVHTLWGRGRDVILHPLGDLIAQHHIVQSPAFVGPCYFLFRATNIKGTIRSLSS